MHIAVYVQTLKPCRFLQVTTKALKEHVLSLSKHEHGHTVIIALLDATDDTVLLNKAILSQILENAHDLACDEWGRKVSIAYPIICFE